MAKENKTKAQLLAELNLLRKAKHIEGGYALAGKCVFGAVVLGCFYYILQMVEVLAGTTTSADIFISVIGKLEVALAWAVGLAGLLYGLRERRLRKNTVKRLQDRNIDLEEQLDNKRTSSGLTKKGKTHPEDRL